MPPTAHLANPRFHSKTLDSPRAVWFLRFEIRDSPWLGSTGDICGSGEGWRGPFPANRTQRKRSLVSGIGGWGSGPNCATHMQSGLGIWPFFSLAAVFTPATEEGSELELLLPKLCLGMHFVFP